jgi:hypothetical protein
MERLNYITTELDTWAQLHQLISATQDLGRIDVVSPYPHAGSFPFRQRT